LIHFFNITVMRKGRLIILLIIAILATVSCDDEIFGPRSLEGTWRVTETSEVFDMQSFMIGIGYFPGDSSRILIDNFSNLGMGYEVVADVSGLSLVIPQQTVRDFRISGSGTTTVNLRRINWTYRIDGDKYTAVFEKQ